MMDEGKPFQLIDVREPMEYEIGHIGGLHIPLAMIPSSADQIAKDKPVIMQCRSGKRSEMACRLLEQQGFDNMYNLTGGIQAWAMQIDPTVQVG